MLHTSIQVSHLLLQTLHILSTHLNKNTAAYSKATQNILLSRLFIHAPLCIESVLGNKTNTGAHTPQQGCTVGWGKERLFGEPPFFFFFFFSEIKKAFRWKLSAPAQPKLCGYQVMKNSETAFVGVKIVSKSLKLQNREDVDFLFRAGSENKEIKDVMSKFSTFHPV